MRTTITRARLTELHGAGAYLAARFRTPDPHDIHQAHTILRVHGEDWAASVLLRTLTRRSCSDAGFPHLTDAELHTLLLADREEWQQFEQAATA